MNKAELESKHLSELHELAAKAGVEGYRMLPRAELIAKLADGGDGGGGDRGGKSRGGDRGGKGGGGGRGGKGRGEGRGRGGGGGEGRGRGGGGGEGRGRGGGGGRGGRGRGSRSGRNRQPGNGREQGKPAEAERREQSAPAPAGGEGGTAKPRRRRRRRFRRKGGKSVRPHELILAAPGGQSIVYGDSRQGCTALLRELASELSGGKGPDPIALLIDPSPEELADWKREAPRAEIVSAGQDRHAEDALAQAARRAEGGEAVLFLIDSVSRIADSFGANVAKDLLADAGSVSGSGTLTIVAALERPA